MANYNIDAIYNGSTSLPGTERVRIDGSGNVGIGTNSPVSKLHISGSGQTIMRLDSSTTTNISQFQIKAASDAVLIMGMYGGSAASTNYGVTAAGQAYFGTTTLGTTHPTSLVIGTASSIPTIFSINNTERMRIINDGNVGIGTSSPSTRLHVYSSANQPILIQGTTAGTWIDFQSSTSNLLSIGADGTRGIGFYNRTTAADLMTISNGGNLGIGTTSPSVRLHVNGSSIITNPSPGSSPVLLVQDDGTSTPVKGGTVLRVVNDGSSADYSVFEASSGVSNFVILNNGNVGIGTTSPGAKLHITGGTELLNTSGSTSSATSGSLMILGQNTKGGGDYHDFLYARNTKPSTTNPQKYFRINSTGAIEIVNNAYTTNILTLTDAGVLSTPGGGTSDRRVKNNIQYIYEDALPTINQLKPVSFEFKNNPDVTRHGFIAQDVLYVKPEFVLGDGDKEDGTYGLDYDGILALTVKALQEATNRIEKLEKELELLKNRL